MLSDPNALDCALRRFHPQIELRFDQMATIPNYHFTPTPPRRRAGFLKDIDRRIDDNSAVSKRSSSSKICPRGEMGAFLGEARDLMSERGPPIDANSPSKG